MSDFSIMSPEEVEAMGLSNIGGSTLEIDNPIVDFMKQNVAMQDREGRQIISFKQFNEIADIGGRLDNYAMWMQWPGSNRRNTIQCTKYLKWYGLGYRAPAELEAQAHRRAKSAEYRREVTTDALPEDVVLFFCRDKYEDCKRVFDSQRGLKFHWNKDHGEGLRSKKVEE